MFHSYIARRQKVNEGLGHIVEARFGARLL